MHQYSHKNNHLFYMAIIPFFVLALKCGHPLNTVHIRTEVNPKDRTSVHLIWKVRTEFSWLLYWTVLNYNFSGHVGARIWKIRACNADAIQFNKAIPYIKRYERSKHFFLYLDNRVKVDVWTFQHFFSNKRRCVFLIKIKMSTT